MELGSPFFVVKIEMEGWAGQGVMESVSDFLGSLLGANFCFGAAFSLSVCVACRFPFLLDTWKNPLSSVRQSAANAIQGMAARGLT